MKAHDDRMLCPPCMAVSDAGGVHCTDKAHHHLWRSYMALAMDIAFGRDCTRSRDEMGNAIRALDPVK
ncbi:MAG: hypothetical protein MPK75_00170 [Alphaproteobacteria bacterium]|nr:hypothetical protein [Alphaproteobacteria bacterium]